MGLVQMTRGAQPQLLTRVLEELLLALPLAFPWLGVLYFTMPFYHAIPLFYHIVCCGLFGIVMSLVSFNKQF